LELNDLEELLPYEALSSHFSDRNIPVHEEMSAFQKGRGYLWA
jgi:hypothetical protein